MMFNLNLFYIDPATTLSKFSLLNKLKFILLPALLTLVLNGSAQSVSSLCDPTTTTTTTTNYVTKICKDYSMDLVLSTFVNSFLPDPGNL